MNTRWGRSSFQTRMSIIVPDWLKKKKSFKPVWLWGLILEKAMRNIRREQDRVGGGGFKSHTLLCQSGVSAWKWLIRRTITVRGFARECLHKIQSVLRFSLVPAWFLPAELWKQKVVKMWSQAGNQKRLHGLRSRRHLLLSESHSKERSKNLLQYVSVMLRQTPKTAFIVKSYRGFWFVLLL